MEQASKGNKSVYGQTRSFSLRCEHYVINYFQQKITPIKIRIYLKTHQRHPGSINNEIIKYFKPYILSTFTRQKHVHFSQFFSILLLTFIQIQIEIETRAVYLET